MGHRGGTFAAMARVLVVDDEPGVRTALARGLVAEGMDVVAVSDGASALRAALTGSFDAVVLDIILPGLSGYRVLERLRAAGVDTPVLLVSAKDGEVDQADGLDLGADGYLVKPFWWRSSRRCSGAATGSAPSAGSGSGRWSSTRWRGR
jgi:DNA-binding response OmpR family regulator